MKDEFGVVHIRGVVDTNGGSVTSNVIFKLPAGYRPSANLTVVTSNIRKLIPTDNGNALLVIRSTTFSGGDVLIYDTVTNINNDQLTYYLDVSFPTF